MTFSPHHLGLTQIERTSLPLEPARLVAERVVDKCHALQVDATVHEAARNRQRFVAASEQRVRVAVDGRAPDPRLIRDGQCLLQPAERDQAERLERSNPAGLGRQLSGTLRMANRFGVVRAVYSTSEYVQ